MKYPWTLYPHGKSSEFKSAHVAGVVTQHSWTEPAGGAQCADMRAPKAPSAAEFWFSLLGAQARDRCRRTWGFTEATG